MQLEIEGDLALCSDELSGLRQPSELSPQMQTELQMELDQEIQAVAASLEALAAAETAEIQTCRDKLALAVAGDLHLAKKLDVDSEVSSCVVKCHKRLNASS